MTPVRIGGLLGAILFAGSMLGGCSEVSPGDPRPTADTSAEATTQPPSSSQKPASDRPRDIKINGMDPCTLIPQSDWAKFEIKEPGKRKVNSASKEPLCDYNGGNLAGFNLTLNSKEGIEAWDESERDVKIAESEPIEGFPAIQFTHRAFKGGCSVVVDVADGQTLDVFTIVSTTRAEPRKCEIAREFAESAMKTLVGGN